ncbi:MAG: RNA 2',3'-cyclic phosphodiesterase [Candidatus Lokiarchaeota archaeon]|nr:RNA 2',3'-cyclic phosphodiesterase [Candidatus Lokiarchaeota archaeon]
MKMIRSFIAIELKDKGTIEKIISFTQRLTQNQPKIKLVEPVNLHMTMKFLGNIPETQAPKIYSILQEEINDKLFPGKNFEYILKGVGQFNKFSVLWIKLLGNIQFLQNIKDSLEDFLFNKLKIERDKRTKFKPHLTIGRLKKDKINYKTFDTLKNLITENKDLEFGVFTINQVKLKKSQLTSKGPIYTDLKY